MQKQKSMGFFAMMAYAFFQAKPPKKLLRKTGDKQTLLILKVSKSMLCLLIFVTSITFSQTQQTNFVGKIIDATTNKPLSAVTIKLEKTSISTLTDALGDFNFGTIELPLGEQIAVISKKGYILKRFPITINQYKILDIQKVGLEYDFAQEQQQIGTITLSDNELDTNQDTSSNVSGLLQASKDVFLKAAAFDFSATFFRPRGLGNENSKVLINGIEMNTLFTGRPQWTNWGGLNDMQRNQEYSMGIAANDYVFGDLSGTTHMIMRASQYRKGSRISYAASNRSYTGRIMASYNSGLLTNGWAYSVLISRRYGNQGYVDGTLYDANSVFTSVEKKINDAHSINFTSFYTPNRRGKSNAVTKEVFELKGRKYNPNWGYQDGNIRNSRVRKIEEPVVMLNHNWNITKKTSLVTNMALQTGKTGNSRIDTGGTDILQLPDGQQTYIGGGSSKDTNPMHPTMLPGFYLQNSNPTALDYQKAFLAQQSFVNNGQLNWDHLISINQLNTAKGNNATYILYEDRTDNIQYTVNTILNSPLSEKITLNAAINYRNLKSENFAEVTDLLGGTSFLDIDAFALSSTKFPSNQQVTNRAQSDLRNRNRTVGVGDRYDYNYEIDAEIVTSFAQAQFNYSRIEGYLGATLSLSSYKRNGMFENGYFPGKDSYGKSEKLNFTNYGAKGGLTFKINGRNHLMFQGTYFTKAPTIQNTFANARQNNITVAQLLGGKQENEKVQSTDVSYILKSPKLKIRLTGYYTKIQDATDISFFFTQAISGTDIGFVQEILTDIDKLHIGGELGIEYQITPTLKLKGAAAVGRFKYNNNPELILTGTNDVFINSENEIKEIRLGKSSLANYRISSGPQNAAQIGFEYRDPKFWWIGATTNYFSNAYLDISPFARTTNFYQDSDGLPFNDYNEKIAKKLLRQEKFDDYFLVNISGGKSWRIKGNYVGVFATINNVLNREYITGGFEQTRNANYRLTLQESQRDTPVFGPRYFYGYGTSYYLNVYLRF